MVYEGGGGVEKVQKTVYMVYERPLVSLLSKCQSKKKLCRYFLTIMYIEILELKAIFFS